MKFNEKNYLTNMPTDVLNNHGLGKTLIIRNEIIHIKHIFTEIFARKSIDINKYLDLIGWDLMEYMEYMTHKIRHVHYINRNITQESDEIVKHDDSRFFPVIELHRELNNLIVLDFDGVVTKNNFKELYNLCLGRCKTVICSANPTIKEEWFTKREYDLPYKIYANKGKIKKIKKLLNLNQRYDMIFYVDNEEEYLELAWLFGIKTYIYKNNTIKKFTMKTN